MSIKYGRIDTSESSFEEQTFNKNQTLYSGSDGVHRHLALYNDQKNPEDPVDTLLSPSGSHWAFVHTMFYSSGSQFIGSGEIDKFSSIYDGYNQFNDLKPFYTNKFHSSASIFYIPQMSFGERIKPGSFQLTARTGSSSNKEKEIIILDDKNGNLYSSNAHSSRSADSHGVTGSVSSSLNYVGNVVYDLGVAVLTDTGSWSGSVSYMDIGQKRGDEGTDAEVGSRDYRFWDVKLNSTTPIFTYQYSIKISAGDFNVTMNDSTKPRISGSLPSGSNVTDAANLIPALTGSGWSPYFNQIQLFRDNTGEEPLLIANLPRNVKMRDDIDLIITFRVDA